MSESDFMQSILDFAKINGWACYHTHDSRRSTSGFPDLVMVRSPRLIFAECKTETGKVTPEQREWLMNLSGCAECYCWRPSEWPEIESTLKRI